MAIPAGLIFLLGGITGLSTGDSIGLLIFVGGVATLTASIYALKATDFYRHWNSGVSPQAKLAAILAIYMGIMMTIALFFLAPFMRFITDAVGSGGE